MAKKNKSEKVETVETPETEATETQEVPRGNRGELGVASAGDTLKQMWHAEHHVLEDVGDAHNPRKQVWVPKVGSPSLKKYAKQLAASGNAVAKEWFANKSGAKNATRTEANTKRIDLERSASKAARRKKSQGKQSKTADATAAPKAK